MADQVDLATLVEEPFELLRELERRSRVAAVGRGSGTLPEEWVGIGFRVEDEHFVAPRDQVREVLMIPESITRVPRSRRWLLGIANLRGHLLPLVDLKLFLGSGRTRIRRTTRVISVNHREIPAGLVVDEVLGFRRFMEAEKVVEWSPTMLRCDRYLDGAFQRSQETWPIFNLHELIESGSFLQAADE